MKLYQLKNSYRYNSDSLILYDFACAFVKNGANLLDVGCGCGVVGLLLARDYQIELSMLDIQEINISLARVNSFENGINAELINADFARYKSEKKYTHIVCNPPFYRHNTTKSVIEHKAISKNASYLDLRDLFSKASSILKPNGELIICYDPFSLDSIMSLAFEFKFCIKNIKFVHPKKDKPAGLVLIRAKKSAKQGCVVMPALIMHDKERHSVLAEEIYKRANLLSIDISLENLDEKNIQIKQLKSQNMISKKGFDYLFDPSFCEKCGGKCCTGESGYIWIDIDEARAISDKLDLDLDIFLNDFCIKVGDKFSLKEKVYQDGFACIFFNEKDLNCGIYSLRPSQCRTFPFWSYFKKNLDELKSECMGVVFQGDCKRCI